MSWPGLPAGSALGSSSTLPTVIGSLRQGRHVGEFGDAEVFSLSGTKPVTSAEGGLLATSNPELADRFRYLRAYGFRCDYHSRYVGLNGKLLRTPCRPRSLWRWPGSRTPLPRGSGT